MKRQIVAYESDPAEADVGRLIAIDPQDATGVPIPAFRYGPTRPTVGQIKGEAFISTVTGIASVWNGNKWNNIAIPVVVKFPDDATLLAATLPDDTVAVSQASGNLFTRVNSKWLPLGIRVYPTQVDLDADAPPDGSLALAADTGEFAVRSAGIWVALANQAINVGATPPPNPVGGNIWIDTSGGQSALLFYDGTNWIATPRAQQGELWITAPAGRGIANGVYTFAEIDAAAWASLEPGKYWVIKELNANGEIPQMQRISQSLGSPISIGDWVVALDTDHNGVTDHLKLVNYNAPKLGPSQRMYQAGNNGHDVGVSYDPAEHRRVVGTIWCRNADSFAIASGPSGASLTLKGSGVDISHSAGIAYQHIIGKGAAGHELFTAELDFTVKPSGEAYGVITVTSASKTWNMVLLTNNACRIVWFEIGGSSNSVEWEHDIVRYPR